MKTQFIVVLTSTVAIVPICFGQANAAKKADGDQKAIIDSEKAAWEAYKTKNANVFKELMAPEYQGVYAEGIQTLETDIADMAKADLREYSLAEVKVVFPRADVALITYKATTKGMFNGQERSGTYNGGGVYIKRGQKWLGVFHTEIKTH